MTTAKHEHGYFSRVGSVHMHIDGVGKDEGIREILRTFDSMGLPRKISAITESLAGPQAGEFPEEYDSHNPVSAENADLDFFATVDISKDTDLLNDSAKGLMDVRARTIEILRDVLARLNSNHGIVVEVERVVGRLQDDGKWVAVSPTIMEMITGNDVYRDAVPTLPIEIHHAIDFEKNDEENPPVALVQVGNACRSLAIDFGGWFLFRSHDQWQYRSNFFMTDVSAIEGLVADQNKKLRSFLDGLGTPYKLKSIAEQIIGIWKFV